MIRLTILLLFCLASLTPSSATASTTPPVTIPMTELPTDDDYDNKDYRRRTPPQSVMLTVDFDTKSMTLTNGIDPSEIAAYEIRDTAGQTLYVFSDEMAFVTTLSTLPPEEYQIIISLPSSSFSGYLYLF